MKWFDAGILSFLVTFFRWVLYWILFLISQHIVSDILNILGDIACNITNEISGKFLKWHCFYISFKSCGRHNLLATKAGCLLFLKSIVHNNYFFDSGFCFLTALLFFRVVRPIISLKFLFRRYAIISCSLKTCSRKHVFKYAYSIWILTAFSGWALIWEV